MHEQVLSLLLMEKALDKDDLTELLLVEQLQWVSTCWMFMFLASKCFLFTHECLADLLIMFMLSWFLFLAGSNGRRRRYYSDELKIAIYLELLAKTDPPVLHHGVSRQVAEKFGVPRLVVQRIWRSGQDYGGITGVKNKLVINCGRKRIELDMEAIKAVRARQQRRQRRRRQRRGVAATAGMRRWREGSGSDTAAAGTTTAAATAMSRRCTPKWVWRDVGN